MSPELEYAKRIVTEHQQPPAPASWRVIANPDLPDGISRIEVEGWVMAVNDSLEIGPGMTHHFVLCSAYMPQFKPSGFRFEQTDLGGVICKFPPGFLDAVNERGAHVRQFHFQFPPRFEEEWTLIRGASGKPVKLRLAGILHDTPPHPEASDGEREAHEFGKFRKFDTSSRCPIVEFDSIRIDGKIKIKSLRLGFSIFGRHFDFEIAIDSYKRPHDCVPAYRQQIVRRAAASLPPN